MAQDRAAHRPGHRAKLILPAFGLRIEDVELADDFVERQVEQAVLGADVSIEGG